MKARLINPHTRASGSDLILVGQRRRAACGDVIWAAIDSVL
jgi:hypothetical protein